MADSSIEWTEKTWNPSTGCTKVSPGCKNCYAERMSARLKGMGQKKYAKGFEFVQHADTLNLPTTWKKPKRVFVNSMSDLFHEEAEEKFIMKVFETMLFDAPQHTYQVLTKRAERMQKYSVMHESLTKKQIPPHIWMGVSVENAETTKRILHLQDTAAMVRFVSFEPLIGDVGTVDLEGVDWAIIGGESGPNARPVKKEWIENIIDQCRFYGVAVFFKQWGGAYPKANGREIDGVTYDEYPSIANYVK